MVRERSQPSVSRAICPTKPTGAVTSGSNQVAYSDVIPDGHFAESKVRSYENKTFIGCFVCLFVYFVCALLFCLFVCFFVCLVLQHV